MNANQVALEKTPTPPGKRSLSKAFAPGIFFAFGFAHGCSTNQPMRRRDVSILLR
jgi:hypothetical protein